MADPLSIAASVTGLLSVAGKICTIISDFISNVADAPNSARDALAAVEEMRMVLTSIRQVMDRLSRLPRNRKEMIHIKHLVITFRELVRSFSELEAIVNPAAGANGRSSKWDRIKWVLEEEKVSHSIQRMELHKTSLSVMLSILQCESDFEARRCLNTLQDTVQKVVDQNQALLRRLEEHDFYRGAEDTSVRFFDNDQSVIQAQGAFSHGPGSSNPPLVLPKLKDPIPLEAAFDSAISPRDFEITLEQTRVYMRVQSNDSDVSFTSSAVRSNAWSILSGLSLNDISVMSVIALPISLKEINSIGPQLTFAKIMSGTEEPEPARTELGHLSSKGLMTMYELAVLGDSDVGKAELAKHIFLAFLETYDPTLEDHYRKKVIIDEEPCMLQVLDTTGQEEYAALLDQWILDNEGFILVYSVTKRSSFLRIKKYHQKVIAVKDRQRLANRERPTYLHLLLSRMPMSDEFAVPIMLVGNESHQHAERVVSSQEGFALATELGCQFLEVSTKNCINVEKAFYDVVRMIRQQRRARGRPQTH